MATNTSVVLRYYLYRAVGGPGFIYPIYVLYLRSHGLSFAQIGVIGAVQSVVVLAGELPSGYVGDRIGRRNSLLVGQFLYSISALGMIVGGDFLAFAAAFSLLSFGGTFVSGSGDAWLYDSLAERLEEDRFTHVRGRGGAVGQWVTALTMVLGGFLYVSGHVYPFVALLAMRVVTFLVVLTLPQNAQYVDDEARGRGDGERGNEVDAECGDEADVERGDEIDAEPGEPDDESPSSGGDLTVLEALPIIRNRLARPPLRSFLAYMALFLATTMTVDAYIQPIAVDALEANVGAHLSAFGVPEAASLGFLYAAFTATSAVASDRASALRSLLGVRNAVLVLPMATAVLLVVPAVAPVVAFPMFFGLKASHSLLRPIAGQYVNDNVESVGRATVLSAVAMVYAVARIPFAVGSGVVADAFSPLVAVAALGAAFLVGGATLQLLWPPVRRGASTGAPGGATSD